MPEQTLARRTRPYDTLRGRLLAWVDKRLGGYATALTEFLALLPDILILLGRVVVDNRVPRPLRVRIGMLLAYLFSPLDLLPEAVLGPLGFLDDFVLAGFVLDRLLAEVDAEILLEHWPGRPEQLDTLRQLADLVVGVFGVRLGHAIRRWFGDTEGAYDGPGGLELVSETESEADLVERSRAAGL